ncbi:hypothetical protein GCM10007989_24430 [Devosia pacifica]|uniref:Uncharacterized protein n=1 Tax=Devosia pacifica TaxID=1335967 RepID=A0A918S9C1_9HYPH|nr:hypothetical protein [Devosia pacifica]GHA27667.1 hypothetical protein GCM10007989_24430 [Devosia pacifica]
MFIKQERWQAVLCNWGDYEEHRVVHCHPSWDDSYGGLFIVQEVEGTAVAYPINGKAKQYTQGARATLVDGTPLPIE